MGAVGAIVLSALITIQVCFAQVISVEEFVQNPALVDKFDLLRIDTTTSNLKYLSVYNGFAKATDERYINIYKADKKIAMLPSKDYPVGIKAIREIKSQILYFACKRNENQPSTFGGFALDGTLVKNIGNCSFDFSPGFAYFYYPCSMDMDDQVKVFDFNTGEEILAPFFASDCQSAAVSDSLLVIAGGDVLTLWNIVSKSKVWETKIPGKPYYTDSAFRPSFSEKANIIMIRDMHVCNCFDYQGNWLWSQKAPGVNRFLDITDLSKDNGSLLIAVPEYEVMQAWLYSRNGELLQAITYKFGRGNGFGGDQTSEAEIYDDIILFKIWTHLNDKKMTVTCMSFRDGNEWYSAIVYGWWHIMSDEAANKKYLIGFGPDLNRVFIFVIR